MDSTQMARETLKTTMGEATQVSSLPLPPRSMSASTRMKNCCADCHHHGHSRKATPCLACLSTVREPIIRLLESRGIRRLYPQNYEHRKELKKLNHSLLVNFLDMVDVLIRCPDTSKRLVKKEDMSLLFVRVHHLIEFRPHQTFGRHSQVMLDMQRWQRLDTAHRFHKELDKVREIL
ncbi:mediator of RNA polymerase II transcription subunit 7 isoform X2 [Dermacentor silvarum]|uniref:mediator of RNA polymerase II transcription subunit 7 isoform X2 n=1 Tax=Dermacentor silvarum TaxID=543639 RepID=UPI002101C792|nr:mediator of RNA polymerase II transcription subunit 7 isoform X2 [Dermacentor silvarum]